MDGQPIDPNKLLEWQPAVDAGECDPCGADPPEPPPGEFAAVYQSAADAVAAAVADATAVYDHAFEDALQVVGGVVADLYAVMSEIAGQIDLGIQSAEQQVGRLWQRLYGEVKRELDSRTDELYAVGVVVPWRWQDQYALLQGADDVLILSSIPGVVEWFRRTIGYVPQLPGADGTTPPIAYDIPPPGSVPGADPTETDRLPTDLPYPPPGGYPPVGGGVPPAPPTGDGGGDSGGSPPPPAGTYPPYYPPTVPRHDPPPTLPPTPTLPPAPGHPGAPLPPYPPPPPPPPVPPVVVVDRGPDGSCCPVDVTVTLPPPVVSVTVEQPPPPPLPPPPTDDVPSALLLPDPRLNANWSQLPPDIQQIQLQMWQRAKTALGQQPAPPIGAQDGAAYQLSDLSPFGDTLVKRATRSIPGLDTSLTIDWNDKGVCAAVAKWLADLAKANPKKYVGSKGNANFNEWSEEQRKAADRALADLFADGSITKSITDTTSAIRDSIQTIHNTFNSAQLLRTVGDALTPGQVRNAAAAALLGGKIGLANLAAQKTGVPVDYLFTGELYAYQFANPQFLPNQVRIDNCYLSNTITSDEWECWTKSQGNLPEAHRSVVVAQATRPIISEAVAMLYRGIIDERQFKLLMRENGVLDETHLNKWVELHKAIPSQSDQISMMVRDAADDRVAAEYGYDEGFKEKWAGQLKQWSRAIGVTEEVMRFNWRSHWRIPSNTQLYEMLHRLRPDRPERVQWEQANPQIPGETDGQYRRRGPFSVTIGDVRTALQVNDVAPGWVDGEIAVSYRPVTRTDALRAYVIGAFDEPRLRDAFLDLGYTPADSDTLLKFYASQKRQRLANTTGVWTTRKTLKAYRDSEVSKDQARALLMPLIPSQSDVSRILDSVDLERAAELRRAQIAAVRTGYRYGEYDGPAAAALLTKAGLSAEQTAYHLEVWEIQRLGRWKQPSAKEITGWVVERLVTADDARRRLMNLGYTGRDAELMIELAIMKGEPKGGMSAEEAGGVYEAAIKTAAAGRKASDTALAKRLEYVDKELKRVRDELNRRARDRGQPLLPPAVYP